MSTLNMYFDYRKKKLFICLIITNAKYYNDKIKRKKFSRYYINVSEIKRNNNIKVKIKMIKFVNYITIIIHI